VRTVVGSPRPPGGFRVRKSAGTVEHLGARESLVRRDGRVSLLEGSLPARRRDVMRFGFALIARTPTLTGQKEPGRRIRPRPRYCAVGPDVGGVSSRGRQARARRTRKAKRRAVPSIEAANPPWNDRSRLMRRSPTRPWYGHPCGVPAQALAEDRGPGVRAASPLKPSHKAVARASVRRPPLKPSHKTVIRASVRRPTPAQVLDSAVRRP
jgi:hypothetical protein